MSPTALTLRRLRRSGYLCDVVQRFIARLSISKDLFGFGDVLAVHPGRREFLIVQSTTLTHLAHRLAKTRAQPGAAAWVQAGGRIELHGWALREGRWQPKIIEVAGEDLAAVVTEKPPARPRKARVRPAELFPEED